MRPPVVPKLSQIRARFLLEGGEIGDLEKAGHAEKHRFRFVRIFAQCREGNALRDERERQLVLFVAERGRDLLEDRFVAAVSFDHDAQPRGLALQPETATPPR